MTGFLGESVDAALSTDRLAGDALLTQAARFAEHPELAQLVDEWRDRTQQAVTRWAVETTTVLERRVQSQAFAEAVDAATGESSARFGDTSWAVDGGLSRVGSVLADAVRFTRGLRAAEIIRAGNHQAARAMAAQMIRVRAAGGSDLAGWLLGSVTAGQVRSSAARQAADLTSKAARIGAVMQVVTGFVDAALLYRGLRVDRMAEIERIEAIQQLREDAAAWADGVVDGHPGLAALRYERASLAELRQRTDDALGTDRADAAALDERIARYEKAMEAGMATLRTGWAR